jgi:hypothetical protein
MNSAGRTTLRPGEDFLILVAAGAPRVNLCFNKVAFLNCIDQAAGNLELNL